MTRLWERFRDYFRQLSTREQILVAGAVLFVVVVGGYLGIVQPIFDRQTRVASQLAGTRALHAWLLGAAREADAMKGAGTSTATVGPASPSAVQQSLREHTLDTAVTRMEPTADGIDIDLKQAPLNLLIGWVTFAEGNLGYVATDADIMRGAQPGTADAKLHLAPGTRP